MAPSIDLERSHLPTTLFLFDGERPRNVRVFESDLHDLEARLATVVDDATDSFDRVVVQVLQEHGTSFGIRADALLLSSRDELENVGAAICFTRLEEGDDRGFR